MSNLVFFQAKRCKGDLVKGTTDTMPKFSTKFSGPPNSALPICHAIVIYHNRDGNVGVS